MGKKDFITKNKKRFFKKGEPFDDYKENFNAYIKRRLEELGGRLKEEEQVLLVKYSDYLISELDIEKGTDLDLYLAKLAPYLRLGHSEGKIILPTERYVRKWPIFDFRGKWKRYEGRISASTNDLVNLSQIVEDLSDFLQPTNNFQSRLENLRYHLYSQERILVGEEVEKYFRKDRLRWEGYRKALKVLEKGG